MEPVRDLNRVLFSAKLDDRDNEALRLSRCPMTFAKLEERDSEPDRDLNSEFFSAMLEAIVQVAVRLVEQDRGLELQTSFPESTFATMLPIANATEAASTLKTERFAMKPEDRVKEPLRLSGITQAGVVTSLAPETVVIKSVAENEVVAPLDGMLIQTSTAR
jgi:hypothetical protein